jgi:hypothetical protein
MGLLCRGTVAGALVVVERKRGRPSDKVIGQAARHMGYLPARMAQPGLQVEGWKVSFKLSIAGASSAAPL